MLVTHARPWKHLSESFKGSILLVSYHIMAEIWKMKCPTLNHDLSLIFQHTVRLQAHNPFLIFLAQKKNDHFGSYLDSAPWTRSWWKYFGRSTLFAEIHYSKFKITWFRHVCRRILWFLWIRWPPNSWFVHRVDTRYCGKDMIEPRKMSWGTDTSWYRKKSWKQCSVTMHKITMFGQNQV